MEVLTIVLLGLLSLASSTGMIADSIAASKIRSQVVDLEQQRVRIDSRPSYSIAQGKLHKIRIATRGVKIQPGLRLEALELETDQVDFQLDQLDLDSIEQLRQALNRPFQGAVRLTITEVDLNRALQSPEILAQIQQVLNRLIVSKAGSTNIAYQLLDLNLEFHPHNRLEVTLKLARPLTNFESDHDSSANSRIAKSRELVMNLALGIEVIAGNKINLIEPQGTVNGRPMSSRLLNGFAVGISDRLNLNLLEQDGILARILQLEIREDKIELASFFKLETKNLSLSSKKI